MSRGRLQMSNFPLGMSKYLSSYYYNYYIFVISFIKTHLCLCSVMTKLLEANRRFPSFLSPLFQNES